jgi:hypothetical protein
MTIVGPIRRLNPVLARCPNQPDCNWSGWVWCPNPFYVMRCPRCLTTRIELPS